jgi:hypothetical protein
MISPKMVKARLRRGQRVRHVDYGRCVVVKVRGDGVVVVRLADGTEGTTTIYSLRDSAEGAEEDPMISAFLEFIQRDAAAHSEGIVPLSSVKVAHAVELTRNVIASDDDVIPEDVTF